MRRRLGEQSARPEYCVGYSVESWLSVSDRRGLLHDSAAYQEGQRSIYPKDLQRLF
jgi:hypothetical protein